MSVEFVDTNVLVYAFDVSAGEKRIRAQAMVHRLLNSGEGRLSTQVLQELYVNLMRKLPVPLPQFEAQQIIHDLTSWQVVEPKVADVLTAIRLSIRSKISFWDALVLVAAQKANATILWSEDLNHGQDYDGVIVQNPFRDKA